MPVDQQFNACTVVTSGDFGISGGNRLLFGPTKVLFLAGQQLLDFQYCFSPLGPIIGYVTNFSKTIIWEKIPSDHDRGLAIDFLDSRVLGGIISEMVSFGLQDVESRRPRDFNNSKSSQQKHGI